LSVAEVTDEIDTEIAYKSFVMELMNAQASKASLVCVCARASEGFKELLDWLNQTATLAAIVWNDLVMAPPEDLLLIFREEK
jgi:hypothetical protein